MKKIIVVLVLFISLYTQAQQTYVYKNNPITGAIDVYKSNLMGLEEGQSVMSFKKNMWGYLEVTDNTINNSVGTDIYTKRPNYDKVKPFQSDYSGLLNDIDYVNQNNEKYIVANNPPVNDEWDEVKFYEDYNKKQAEITAKQLLFYNSFSIYPTHLKDGLHNAQSFNPSKSRPGALNVLDAKIEIKNGSVTQIYTINHLNQKDIFELTSISQIKNCTITVVEKNTGVLKFYFMEALVDN